MRRFVKIGVIFLVVFAIFLVENELVSGAVIPDLNPLGNPFTISAWINTTNSTFIQSIYSRWSYNNGNLNDPRGFEIVLNWPNPQSIAIWDTYTSRSSPPYSVGNWIDLPLTFEAGREYHLAIVRNGTNITFYLDAVNRGSLAITSSIPDVSSVTPRVGRSNYDVNNDPVSTRPFQGTIENSSGVNGKVDIYDQALPAIEISAIRARGQLRGGGVSSVGCLGGDNQTIMSLSGLTNAHGALWNDSNYQYKICYDQIFGVNYTGANPHSCTAGNSNILLKISDTTNAHGQSPFGYTGTPYSTPICYGDLSCILIVAGDDPTRRAVVYLSDVTNAHLSANNSYTSRISCSSQNTGQAAPGTIYSYFTNSTGNKIANSYVNNSVNIVVETGLTSGTANIEIYEDDGASEQSIRTGANAISAVIGSDGKARASWEITDADIAAGAANDVNVPLISDSDLEFFVNVSLVGNSNVSGILKTSRSEGPHSAPKVVIGSPLNEEIYFVGNAVNFSQASYGERSFNLNWDVDDSLLDVLKKNASTFTHIYSTPGVKKIVLTATDKSGLSGSSSMNIVVLNNLPGIQVIPIIESPGINSKVSSNIVNYNASHSYILNVSANYNISCLGGMCPTVTAVCPPAYYSGIGAIILPILSVVNGYGICQVPIKNDLGLRNNYGSMSFNWTFVESTGNSTDYGLAKTGGTNQYSNYGQKQIWLNLSAYGLSGIVFNPFEITGVVTNNNGCSSDGRWWYENGLGYNTSISGYCGGADHKAGGLKDCCPSGNICTSTGLFGGIRCSSDQCIQFANKNSQDYMIRLCDDYNYVPGDNSTKEFQCNSDCNYAASSSQQIAAISAGLGSGVDLNSIVCTWADNQCSAAQYTSTGSTQSGTTSEYQCIMEITSESTCDRNEKTVDYVFKRANKYGSVWKIEADTDSKCAEKGSIQLRCGSSSIVLPVFDNYQFVMTIFGILLVYTFVAFRKSNKKRE